MKQSHFASLTLLLAGILLSSCATQRHASSRHPGFQDVDAASVVLHYSGWERIQVIQPEYREAGFLVQMSPKQIGATFDQLGVKRDMAVVVIAWDHSRENLNEVVSDWKGILRSHGFKRIVCLEAGRSKGIRGLQVLDDSQTGNIRLRTASL